MNRVERQENVKGDTPLRKFKELTLKSEESKNQVLQIKEKYI